MIRIVRCIRSGLLVLIAGIVTPGLQGQTLTDRSLGRDTLFVRIVGIEYERMGQLKVSVYDSEENWLKKGFELRVATLDVGDQAQLTLSFPDLKTSNTLAVTILHDVNDNDKLDFRWFPPIPLEGSGMSNNHRRMGAPLYEPARLNPELGNGPISIEMVYYGSF